MKWLVSLILGIATLAAASWYLREPLLAMLPGAIATAKDAGVTKDGASSSQNRKRGGNGSGSEKPGPALVTVLKITAKPLPVEIAIAGVFEPIASIAIKPRLDSQIRTVHIAEGAHVAVGTKLFTLDARGVEAQLAQLEAQIAKDQAELELARSTLGREQQLVDKKIKMPSAIEQSKTALDVAAAQVKYDEAQRDALRVTLSYSEIAAPVAGRIGSIAAKPGASVRSGDLLATLNQIDPIYVRFAVPQAMLAGVKAAMKAGSAKVTAERPGGSVDGTIAFMENSVDASGSVIFKATMPNGEEAFWPGQTATIRLQIGEDAHAILVPSGAVLIGQNGSYVVVVVDGKATIRPVTVARIVGETTVIEAGLAAGETIAIDGQTGLSDGAAVRAAPAAGRPAEAGSTLKPASHG